MRVVYLNPTGQLGGAERALLDFMVSLQTADSQFTPYLIASSDGPFVAEATAHNIPTTILPFPPALARLGDSGVGDGANKVLLLGRLLRAGFGCVSYLRLLRKQLRKLTPDIIHTNGFKMHVLGTWARPKRTPMLWHIHDYVSSRPVMAKLLKRYARECSAIITNTHSVAEDVATVCGPQKHLYPIHYGIDLQVFSPAGPTLDLDKFAGLPPAAPDTVRVALFATMARWKGHEVFLKAISHLPPTLPLRAYVVGGALYQTDGSQHSLAGLRQLADELGIAEKVGFTGFIATPAAAMRACDIVVHSSTQPEPFGLVIVEAMACARPVIVSMAGGAAELVEEGINCLGHPPGDAIALSKCIQRLVEDAQLRLRLSQAGHDTATDGFNRTHLAQKLLPIYEAARERAAI